MDISNLSSFYKEDKLDKPELEQTNDQDELIQCQELIFNQLQSAYDTNDIYNYLSLLSETIVASKENILNKNFYSEWFTDLIKCFLYDPKLNISTNPILTEICIIIITKLSFVFNLKSVSCFFDQKFIDIYFNLLKLFNDEEKYDIAIEKSDDPMISLRIGIIRLISLISEEELFIEGCVSYTDEIIKYLTITQNEELILFYSSFILNVLKYEKKIDKNPLEFNLKIKTIIDLIKSPNEAVEKMGIEIFNQFLPLYENKADPEFLSENIPCFIELLDHDSYEIVSLVLRVFETLYSIQINFECSEFHPSVLNKATKLLLHRYSTVVYSAVKCICSFTLNLKDEITSSDELIHNLLVVGKKGGFDLQMNIACALSNIINKSTSSFLSSLPIQNILCFIIHVFDSDCYSIFDSLFQATFKIIDVTQTFQIDFKVLQPIVDFNFDPLLDDFPQQVELMNLKKGEIKEAKIEKSEIKI